MYICLLFAAYRSLKPNFFFFFFPMCSFSFLFLPSFFLFFFFFFNSPSALSARHRAVSRGAHQAEGGLGWKPPGLFERGALGHSSSARAQHSGNAGWDRALRRSPAPGQRGRRSPAKRTGKNGGRKLQNKQNCVGSTLKNLLMQPPPLMPPFLRKRKKKLN